MSDPEQAYANFDFSSDARWQEYYSNLFPTPTMNQIGKIKRKWFKKFVDANLDVDAGLQQNTNESSTSTTHTQQQTDSSAGAQQSANQPSGPAPMPGGILGKILTAVGTPFAKVNNLVYKAALPMKDKFYFAEGILKIAFIISAFLMPSFASMIAFNACLLGFFRQAGQPKWDIAWGKKALENEFLQNILYMIPFTFFPNSKTLVFFLPLGIHFWIGFCEFVNMRLPALYPKIAKFANFTRANRATLMYQKAKLEIMLMAFIVILLFFGGSNLILILFYGNFLKTKYLLNPLTKSAFQEINNWVEVKSNHPYCPAFVKSIIKLVRSGCAYLVKV